MIRIAICDDEELYCKRIADFCQQYFGQEWQGSAVEYSLEIYVTSEELLKGELPDILLLDIELPGINGIQIKEMFQKNRMKTRILYITSHPEMMREAFGFQVFGFLEKPLDYGIFCEKMNVAIWDILTSEREICYQELDIPRRVKISKIKYINAAGKYSYLCLEEEAKMQFTDESLGWWERELAGEFFVRCHHSYIVNCAFVRKYEQYKVILNTGEEIPMSRRRKEDVKEVYLDYVRASAR